MVIGGGGVDVVLPDDNGCSNPCVRYGFLFEICLLMAVKGPRGK